MSRFPCRASNTSRDPDSKVHAANMRPTRVLSASDRPHVDPMNLAIRGVHHQCNQQSRHREVVDFSVNNWRIIKCSHCVFANIVKKTLCCNGKGCHDENNSYPGLRTKNLFNHIHFYILTTNVTLSTVTDLSFGIHYMHSSVCLPMNKTKHAEMPKRALTDVILGLMQCCPLWDSIHGPCDTNLLVEHFAVLLIKRNPRISRICVILDLVDPFKLQSVYTFPPSPIFRLVAQTMYLQVAETVPSECDFNMPLGHSMYM